MRLRLRVCLFLSVNFFIILCDAPQIGAVCSSFLSEDLTFQVGGILHTQLRHLLQSSNWFLLFG